MLVIVCGNFQIKSWEGVTIFNFIEELLPGTDFIPSFTIMWFLQGGLRKQPGKTTVITPAKRSWSLRKMIN